MAGCGAIVNGASMDGIKDEQNSAHYTITPEFVMTSSIEAVVDELDAKSVRRDNV